MLCSAFPDPTSCCHPTPWDPATTPQLHGAVKSWTQTGFQQQRLRGEEASPKESKSNWCNADKGSIYTAKGSCSVVSPPGFTYFSDQELHSAVNAQERHRIITVCCMCNCHQDQISIYFTCKVENPLTSTAGCIHPCITHVELSE